MGKEGCEGGRKRGKTRWGEQMEKGTKEAGLHNHGRLDRY